ncbi:MAG: hypothetical protein AB9869_25985 [Verrucomicrobiia bacterium]
MKPTNPEFTMLVWTHVGSRSKRTRRLIWISTADWPTVRQHRWQTQRTKRRDSTGRLASTHIAFARIRGRRVYLNRLLLGAGPAERVLFLNGHGLDCRRSNLRKISQPKP